MDSHQLGAELNPAHMPVPSLSPATGILSSFQHTSIDEGNIGAARMPSSEMKIWIKLLQDKVDIEHCPMPRVLVLPWKWVTLPPFSPLFPIAFLIERAAMNAALCAGSSTAWQKMQGVI